MTLLCRLRSFAATYLDPAIWRLALEGFVVQVDGHTYAEPRYELRDGREYEYRRCVTCKRDVEQGWRWA